MRKALMSKQMGITTYAEDMLLREVFELGNPGACRRR